MNAGDLERIEDVFQSKGPGAAGIFVPYLIQALRQSRTCLAGMCDLVVQPGAVAPELIFNALVLDRTAKAILESPMSPQQAAS